MLLRRLSFSVWMWKMLLLFLNWCYKLLVNAWMLNTPMVFVGEPHYLSFCTECMCLVSLNDCHVNVFLSWITHYHSLFYIYFAVSLPFSEQLMVLCSFSLHFCLLLPVVLPSFTLTNMQFCDAWPLILGLDWLCMDVYMCECLSGKVSSSESWDHRGHRV